MSATIDGGAVEGTGGGKFGAPKRWTRPENARDGVETWSATLMVGGIGHASYGRREGASFDLLVLCAGGRCGWRMQQGPHKEQGEATTVEGAKRAVLTAARAWAVKMAERAPESTDHPPIGPMVWPG